MTPEVKDFLNGVVFGLLVFTVFWVIVIHFIRDKHWKEKMRKQLKWEGFLR